MNKQHDETIPGSAWKFDEGVTAVFDDMLARSIPQYEVMRKACFDLGVRFSKPHTSIVDLGCSRGEALAPFVDKYGARNHFIGIEISEPMLQAVRERFSGMIKTGIVDIRKMDLREEFPYVSASLIMSVFTLQFTPIEYRQRILADVYNGLVGGGAFILVEKVLGADAEINKIMIDTYLRMKADHGYTQEQIERKRLALEGVLVPVTAAWNEELLKMAGFRHVDCFWRWMNFSGWIAIKDNDRTDIIA